MSQAAKLKQFCTQFNWEVSVPQLPGDWWLLQQHQAKSASAWRQKTSTARHKHKISLSQHAAFETNWMITFIWDPSLLKHGKRINSKDFNWTESWITCIYDFFVLQLSHMLSWMFPVAINFSSSPLPPFTLLMSTPKTTNIMNEWEEMKILLNSAWN